MNIKAILNMAGIDDANKLSVVFMSPRWQCDGYGIATITRSLINDLYNTDPEGEGLKLTCMVLEEDGKISQKDRDDAEKYNVTLAGVKLPKGTKGTVLDLGWLNIHPVHWHITEMQNIDVVIGHIPYIAHGPENLKELCKQQGIVPQVGLVVHSFPQDDDGDIDDKLLIEWLKGADFILSVGKGIKMEIDGYLDCFEDIKKPGHELYLPGCSLDLLKLVRKSRAEPVKGPQIVTMITGEHKDLKVKGLDFKLAIGATAKATSKILEQSRNLNNQVSVNFTSVGASADEKDSWKQNFDEITDDISKKDKRLKFTHKTMQDEEEFRNILKRSDLCILPLHKDAKLFGIEALMAAYVGVPLLVGRNAGIADLLYPIPADDSMIEARGAFWQDVENWMSKITKKIMNVSESEEDAKTIKKYLLEETSIEASHQKFAGTVLGKACALLQCELEEAGEVTDSMKQLAKKLKINIALSNNTNVVEMYIYAFTQYFLLQNKKIEIGLLDNELLPEVKEVWIQFIGLLERRGRKVLDIKKGSLLFSVYCPTQTAANDLQELTQTGSVGRGLQNFLKEVGLQKPVTKSQVIRNPMLSVTTQTGRFRIKENREPSSGVWSEGSTISDDEITADEKTVDWLARNVQSQATTLLAKEANSVLSKLKKCIDLPHIGDKETIPRFNFSPTNEIMYSQYRKENKRYISQLHVADRKLVIQKNTCYKWDLAYIQVNGNHQLVTSQDEQLFVWNSGLEESKLVYTKSNPEADVKDRSLSFCPVSENSLACVHRSNVNGYHEIDLLEVRPDKWFPIKTLRAELRWNRMSDMCYTSSVEVPQLVLCSFTTKSVASVGLNDGKLRWKITEKQAGITLGANSICADQLGRVFISCGPEGSICILSAEDGAFIGHLTLDPPIHFPNCVRMHKEKLWVSHRELQAWKKGISKWQVSQYDIE